MSHYHAVVWIDHHEAKIFEFNPDDAEKKVVRPDNPKEHKKTKRGRAGTNLTGKRAPEDPDYYDDVAKALEDTHEVLVCGPADAKLALVKRIERKHPQIADKIVGVETVDHPTDNQLVAYARHYFEVEDKMRPQVEG